MMYGARIRLTGELEALSDLHVGGARPETYQENGESRECAVVLRGKGGPVIPASTLKGVLRHALTDPKDAVSDPDARTKLREAFGMRSEHREGAGQAARLWLENANVVEGDIDEHKHVSIDRTTGAARDNQLYTHEMVRKGARFSFAADWLGEDRDALARTLAPLATGLALGKGTSKGHGQVRLDTAQLSVVTIAPENGDLKERPWTAAEVQDFVKKLNEHIPAANERIVTLKLTCAGPFISVAEIGGADDGGAQNLALPLMRDGKPWLHPESLIGALRTRAAWLAEVGRAGAPDGAPDVARGEDIPMDDMKLEKALGDRRRVEKAADREKLSWVERLFGVTGLRASVRVVSLECTQAGATETLTSNSLDRVTGATREGFLFARECAWGVEFMAKLAVPEDAPGFDDLLSDLRANGLELGHGVTKGFGWFEVVVAEGEGG